MKPYMQIAIRTKAETTDWRLGEELIASLNVSGGLLVPEQVSHNADKFVEAFMGGDESQRIWASKVSIRIDGALSDFYQDFAWRRKKTLKCSGSVVHTARNARGQLVPGAVSFRSAVSAKIDWYSLFKEWCKVFPPQLGMLHLFSNPELGAQEKYNSFQVGSFNSALKPDVPNMGWAMFFGDEFAAEVDVDRIAASGFLVESLSHGYLVRVTANIQDVAENFLLFSRRRAELKRLFRKDLFLIKDEVL
ncbi:MAG: hypothetical protein EOO38_04850 [Cytophagaceae bacterium]|nr:MAG: hypothetical protein EOO38_04850 [Cytophagaceae bacterium]